MEEKQIDDDKTNSSAKQTSSSVADNTVLCNISISKLAFITVALPFIALFICFISAYSYRYDEVHETHCRVYNVIPSISAITGITPQTYLWRVFVALHIGPRILVAHLYKNYFKHVSNTITPLSWFNKMTIDSCYWFNLIELSSLCGVTYISNKENYPVHEKLFIIFMIFSLTYMSAMTRAYKIVHSTMTEMQKLSFMLKKILLNCSFFSTILLILFFMKHRLFCHDLAFTWFAFSEYIIAACNMGFHLTVTLDFPNEKLLVKSNTPVQTEMITRKNN